LIRELYFDGTQVIRVQDNFVTQWGDPDGDDKKTAKSLGSAKETLTPEFTRKLTKDIPFTKLPDGDVYAPEVGFSEGFPWPKTRRAAKRGSPIATAPSASRAVSAP